MAKLLQVDFKFHGPFGKDMSDALVALAHSINQEPGMIWKIWTESEKDKLGGGIYLFEDEETAQAYLEMHTKRLQQMGVSEVRGQIFDINEPLSLITHAPMGE
ncbi:monooxygenase [Photobacterium damselae subsp. damselae]|uniref:monooxygenase n=1 Tax=Photobacterium damselae TaxID=38293 RepID=UPI00084BAC62|nr:monooxygenase [Photobacterium damselae]OEC82725.1 monooxygenase [Photobacterium damselae subsp. damselae]